MTKIDIISGFLGAGKTTLIKKLLEEAYKGEKVVLIENEFGEIGIDGGFLKDAGVEITEMNSGCICCSLVGDFGKSLKEVLERFSPDRIIIEPSGVGKLSDVIKAVQDVQEDLPDAKLNSFSTVVDVSKAAMYMKNFGEFFNNQVESAKTIILSRTQKYDAAKTEVVVGKLRAQNPKAILITTAWDEIDGKVILSAMEQESSFEKELLAEAHHHHEHHHHEHGEDCTCGCHDHDHEHHHHHHHADEVFTSWGKETPHKYERETMREILNKLANTEEYGVILRAKGMVPATDGTWIYFDLTPGEFELREGQPDYTGRLCVIGSKIKEDALEVLFELA